MTHPAGSIPPPFEHAVKERVFTYYQLVDTGE